MDFIVPPKTEGVGIFQADLIVRSAIMLAIADIRSNPWLLDYAFASLPRDTLTAKDYGEQEVAAAKKWFQNTEIFVFLNVNPNEVKFPCVSISLTGSVEQDAEGTLGDVHYEPLEANFTQAPVLAGPLSAIGYSATTGLMVIDPTLLKNLVLAPGMLIVTKTGRTYPILDVLDQKTFKIAPGTVEDFGGFVVRASSPSYISEMESTIYKETYALGCHVDGEPVHLTYLHSILVFAMLRYKETLLEARGFERSTLASTDFKRDEQDLPEMLYSRYIQVTGNVRQVWPKHIAPTITSTITDVAPELDGVTGRVTDIDLFEDIADADGLAFIAPR